MSQRHVNESADPESEYRAIADRTLTGRFATPKELAQVICFLTSTEADCVHGANVMADMGFAVH
jgi:NAD(P)-dependent dehydrogenase (short-subunit alcohol dehydrogenase family)